MTGFVIEAGFQSPDGSAPGYAAPRAVSLEIEGRKPLRFSLGETDAPQFLPVPGTILEKAKLRFFSGAGNGAVAKPMAVREVRFVGLPYD